jgi:excinuclease UvrABC nuclease subunit
LSRVLGTDLTGILYIGKSENLKERVRMLWRVLQPTYKATAHTFGMNYKSMKVIQDAFPFDTLAIEYEENPTAKVYEKSLIETYRQLYGEVPP